MMSEGGYRCDDCGSKDPLANQYMVRDTVWQRVFPSRAGFCCIPCLERRLGRRLRPGDFIAAPINALIRERLAYLAGAPAPGVARALIIGYPVAVVREALAAREAYVRSRAAWSCRRPRRRRRR